MPSSGTPLAAKTILDSTEKSAHPRAARGGRLLVHADEQCHVGHCDYRMLQSLMDRDSPITNKIQQLLLVKFLKSHPLLKSGSLSFWIHPVIHRQWLLPLKLAWNSSWAGSRWIRGCSWFQSSLTLTPANDVAKQTLQVGRCQNKPPGCVRTCA